MIEKFLLPLEAKQIRNKMNDFYTKLRSLMPLTAEKRKGDFRKDLADALEEYSVLLRNNKDVRNTPNIDQIIRRVADFSSNIIESVHLYYKGMYSTAYRKIEEILSDSLYADNYLTINKDDVFYRVRVFDEYGQKSYKDMFHVPFSSRDKIATNRYSAPGYPCLYLGANINACWEELGQPRFDDLMVSRFIVKEAFPVLDLRIPTQERLKDDGILERIPLIIASTIPVLNRKALFKPEYIIPQLITEYVITKNRMPYEQEEYSLFDFKLGIYYTSSRLNSKFGFPQKTFDNMALPSVLVDDKSDYCQLLASCFEWTDPTSYSYEDIREKFGPSMINIGNGLSPEESCYVHSKMGELESRISSFETKRFGFLVIDKPEITLPAEGGSVSVGIRSSSPFTIE